MNQPGHLKGTTARPHIIACAYEGESIARSAYQSLKRSLCPSAGVMRIQSDDEPHVVVACADDAAAGEYMARHDWGDGAPLDLPPELCLAVATRRAEGARRAGKAGHYESEGMKGRLPYESADGSFTTIRALNTAMSPWLMPGGVCGALCVSAGESLRIRERFVEQHLDAMHGMVTAFNQEGRPGIVAVISDDTETEQLAHDELSRLAGNMRYRPSAGEAWALWAVRLTSGSASLPVSFDGDLDSLEEVLSGGPASLSHVKAHAPTRNQPCPCGSGRKYKHCCGG